MRALITGVTGQDGWYLSEFLLSKDYEVHGLARWSSREGAVPEGVIVHRADVTDTDSIGRVMAEVMPDEVYNLAAITDARASVDLTIPTYEVTGLGACKVIDAAPRTARVFQAGSALQYQAHPYGLAKLFAYQHAQMRRAEGRFVVNAIMHNHESPRHATAFLVPKVARAVADIAAGRSDRLVLGDFHARRDWGWAPDYVRAMWLSLRTREPGDWVFTTGETHAVRDVVETAFTHRGLDWRDHVAHGPSTLPQPPDDGALAAWRERLAEGIGWAPTLTFEEMVHRMVDAA